jgi:F-type H+-transporting ATPase subunit b
MVLRASLMEKSRAEADELLSRARSTIEGETRAALVELRSAAADLAVAAAGKLLEANLDDKKQRELAERAIASLTADQIQG